MSECLRKNKKIPVPKTLLVELEPEKRVSNIGRTLGQKRWKIRTVGHRRTAWHVLGPRSPGATRGNNDRRFGVIPRSTPSVLP